MSLTPTQFRLLQLVSECTVPITPAQMHYTSKIPHQTVKQYFSVLFKLGLLDKPIPFSYVISKEGAKVLEQRSVDTQVA